jgi:hypothetical protein
MILFLALELTFVILAGCLVCFVMIINYTNYACLSVLTVQKIDAL